MAERETATGQSEAGRAPLPLGVPRVWRPGAKTVPLDRAEMLRYLGYHGQKIEPELAERIDAVTADAVTRTAPAGVWAVFPRGTAYDTPVKREHPVSADQKVKREHPVSADQKVKREHPVSADQTPVAAGHIALEGTALALTGRDIFRHLKDARYVAVLAVTLGMASEQRLRVLSSQNPLEGAVFDAACSALVESATDALNCEIEAAAQAAGLSSNARFSPGYGNLPLAVQPTVLATLNATRLCGITATPTNLLMPTKSITAFIGLFEGDPHSSDAVRSCAGCRVALGCPFRARGTRCW